MTYRTVMVGLDGAPTCAARTEVAIHLAQDFDAHLIGVAPTGLVDLPAAPGAAALLGVHATSAWLLLIEQAEEAAGNFRARCEAARLPSFEAITDEGPVATSLAGRAHCTDLLVMSQPDPTRAGHRHELSTLEQVLLHGARPTLLVPCTHHGPLRMRRMLIGWDESREAVRAMTDALPLLRRAQQVLLAHWRHEPDGGRALQRLHSMHQWLAFQGVDAQPQDLVTTLPIGEAMLSAACDLDTDLIVMGAYSHPRWSELLFGGTSSALLSTMTVPVLMSH